MRFLDTMAILQHKSIKPIRPLDLIRRFLEKTNPFQSPTPPRPRAMGTSPAFRAFGSSFRNIMREKRKPILGDLRLANG